MRIRRAVRARRRVERAEVRRFTAGSRRRRRSLLVVGAGLAALVATSAGLAYSPVFAVAEVRVTGTDALDPAAVAAGLAAEIGTPLALVDDGAVRDELAAFPRIARYTLERRPPDTLVVHLEERVPIGQRVDGAGAAIVDAAGVELERGATPFPDLPVVVTQGAPDEAAAFAAASAVLVALPADVRARVRTATATTRDDVQLDLADDVQVRWGDGTRASAKAAVLAALLAEGLVAGNTVDVSSPTMAVVAPRV